MAARSSTQNPEVLVKLHELLFCWEFTIIYPLGIKVDKRIRVAIFSIFLIYLF